MVPVFSSTSPVISLNQMVVYLNKTKYAFAYFNLFLKNKYTCSFKRKMLPNSTCALIYSLTKCVLEDDFKYNCSANFFIFDGVYCKRSYSMLSHKLFERSASLNIFLRNLRIFNITNSSNLDSKIFFSRCEVVVDKILDNN